MEEVVQESNKKCVCEYPGCKKSYGRPYHLKRHYLYAHTSERPYKCDYEGCTASYAIKEDIETHKKGHLKERPFVCTFEGF